VVSSLVTKISANKRPKFFTILHSEMKEIIVDFRKNRSSHAPPLIGITEVEVGKALNSKGCS